MMFQDFSQLARYTSASPRGGGFSQMRDLMLPKAEKHLFERSTEKTTTTPPTEDIATKWLGAQDATYLESVLKYGEVHNLNAQQRQARENVLAHVKLFFQLGHIATFVHPQSASGDHKFSLIEFLVERTAGFATAQSIFNRSEDPLKSEVLRNWGWEHGLDQDELLLLVAPARPVPSAELEGMSHHFSHLRTASEKRHQGLLQLNSHFPEVIDTEIFSYTPIIVTFF